MTWDESGNLISVTEPGETTSDGASAVSYTYLSDGLRRTKTVNGVTTTYRYNNGILLSETIGDETLYYYDSTGKVAGIGLSERQRYGNGLFLHKQRPE